MFFSKYTERLRDWFQRNAESKHSFWWLMGISFAESSFFPIPPDPFLMAILLVKKDKWLFYSFMTALASVFGGIFGYLVGFLFFETLGKALVSFYHLENELLIITKFFDQNAFWTMFTVAFTPIPYKIFTIAAGLFHVNLPIFILASIIGRGMRFFIVGLIMKLFGDNISRVVFKYFDLALLAVSIVIIGYVIHQIV